MDIFHHVYLLERLDHGMVFSYNVLKLPLICQAGSAEAFLHYPPLAENDAHLQFIGGTSRATASKRYVSTLYNEGSTQRLVRFAQTLPLHSRSQWRIWPGAFRINAQSPLSRSGLTPTPPRFVQRFIDLRRQITCPLKN